MASCAHAQPTICGRATIGGSTVRRLFLCAGIVSPALWLGLIAVASVLQPGFSPVTHFISELAARGSTHEGLMRYVAFGFTGFLYLCFAIGLVATFRSRRTFVVAASLIAVEGIGRMGAGVFPCDQGCIPISAGPDLHKLFATIGFSAGILAAMSWGVLMRRLRGFEWLSWPSIGSGLVALVSLLIMTWREHPFAGLLEHIATLVLSLWLLTFAWTAHNQSLGNSRAPAKLM